MKLALFCHKEECKKDYLFNKQVTHERYVEVKDAYYKACDGWEAYQTNGNELYKEAGCSWVEVDMEKFSTIGWEESWKSMPQEAIDYLKGLEEFNAEIFKEITGIDVDKKHTIKIDGKEIELSKEGFEELKKQLT